MDSPLTAPFMLTSEPATLPRWSLMRAEKTSDTDAAFAAGIALKSLDDLVRAKPRWVGCWGERQALKCAVSALRLMGRNEDEAALRDAVLLTAPGNDPGLAGNVFLGFKRLAVRKPGFSTKTVVELADLLGLAVDERLTAIVAHADTVRQAGRPAPFAAADLISALYAERPDAEALAFALADQLIALMLSWEGPVPLLMSERFGSAFRILGGRGRVRPGEPGFDRAICLALVEGADRALCSAAALARRAEQLLAIAPKIRTKGKEAIIQKLLNEDALSASAAGSDLSRWASTRMFDRLETFGAVRELSGRSSFKIYGL